MIKEGGKVFLAHYRITDDRIQTVEEHLEGVKTKCERYAEQLQFGNTGRLLGVLHDMGKYTEEFYDYINESVRRQKAGEPKLNSTVDHGKHGAILVLERYHDKDIFGRMMSEIAAMLICYHHGGLEDFMSEDLNIPLLNRCGYFQGNGITEASYVQARERFLKRVISTGELDELFDKAAAELKVYITAGKNKDSDPYYNLHLLIKFLYSCLIDADRYDTYLFMQVKKEEETQEIQHLWEKFDQRLAIREENFRKQETGSALEETVKMLRQDIWKQCNDFGSKQEGVYTLTVPTGGGKTLSSLRYALNHARRWKKKRILYVLPFTAIIEQNAGVVRDALETGNYLLEHHSNVADAREASREEIEYRQLLTEQWTSPIIFTTMVQFLNTFFSGGTRNIRRLHNLTDTILIFDEIQALPIKCISLFNEAVNFLCSRCGDTVLLCSATQPGLDTVAHKINIKQEIITDLNKKFEDFKRMEIVDMRYKGKMSLPQLGEFIYDLKKGNESILIILNTKKTAEAVFQEVGRKLEETDTVFYFLSTNLCPAHRKQIMKEMKEVLRDHRQVVCVSTQLIEAGVDISFSCVVRHLAGLDSIAQASGRGNRNGEGEVKNTYIIELEEEILGSLEDIKLGESGTIYVLDEYRRDRERFESNLLSPEAIKRYYKYFYAEGAIESKMDYPVSDTSNTKRKDQKESVNSIYKMLSNPQKKASYEKSANNKYPLMLEFQFKTAGKYFEVIDEFSEAVLVPYGNGKNIISKLQSFKNIMPDMELIRSAQPYMVNVSKKVLQRLKDRQAVYMEERSGIWILADHFYNKELGVAPEGGRMDALII